VIGDTYDVKMWNCTHEVAQWYRLNDYPVTITPVDSTTWGMSFVRWMRKQFSPLDAPEQGALVLMTNRFSGGLHVGVWDQNGVHHCYQPDDGSPGQAVRSPLSIVSVAHKNITFWRMNNV